MDFSRSEKRTLARLADRVYEAELAALLKPLRERVEEFGRGEVEAGPVARDIRAFCRHELADLDQRHRTLKAPVIVARGVAHGLIQASEVPDPLRNELAQTIAFFQEEREGEQ